MDAGRGGLIGFGFFWREGVLLDVGDMFGGIGEELTASVFVNS